MIIHSGRIESRVQRQCDAAVDADRWIEDAVQVAEGDRSLRHFVHEEAERVPFQVEEDADGAAGRDAALDSSVVHRIVLKPGPLAVDVHCEAPFVFAWNGESECLREFGGFC